MKKQYSLAAILAAVFLTAVVTAVVTYLQASASAARYYSRESLNEESSLADKAALVQEYIDEYFIGEVDETQVEDEMARGMIAGLGDRWSHYLNAEEYQNYKDDSENQYVGIGVSVLWDEQQSLLEVTSVTEGSPAEEAGLQTGDVVLQVDGKTTQQLGYDGTVNAVRGEEGTTVTLLLRRGSGAQETVTVERRFIDVVSLTYEMLGEIGYIRIENFGGGVADRFDQAIDALVEQGVQGLIFDVRLNPGGHLSELTQMLDRLLPEGPLFRSWDKQQREEEDEQVIYSDTSEIDLPMAVLIGEDTYSAAEFFPAALHEYDKAILVGTPTTGKGYAQVPIELGDGTAIVLSIEEYRTPKGVSLAEEGGIDPDVTVEMTQEQLNGFLQSHEDDPVLEEALRLLRQELAEEKAG